MLDFPQAGQGDLFSFGALAMLLPARAHELEVLAFRAQEIVSVFDLVFSHAAHPSHGSCSV